MPELLSGGKTRLYTTSGGIHEAEKLGITGNTTLIEQGKTYPLGDHSLTAVYCDHGELAPDAVGLLIEISGLRIYAVGDSALRPDKADLLPKYADLMITPINGAFGNLNESEAVELVSALRPETVLPCHYGNFAEHGGDVNLFKRILENTLPRQKYIVCNPGDIFMLNK